MRAASLWAASCVAGLVTFSCFGDDDDGGNTTGGKGGVTPEGGASDTGGRSGSGGASTSGVSKGGEGGGTFGTCCVDNRTDQCFCPAGVECNFGWDTEFFPDGSCCLRGVDCSNGGAGGGGGTSGAGGEAGSPVVGGDGGVSGAGGRNDGVGGEGAGTWEQCCEDGITSRCFCEAGLACNFGQLVDFYDDGTCCQLDAESRCVGGAGGGGGGGVAGSKN